MDGITTSRDGLKEYQLQSTASLVEHAGGRPHRKYGFAARRTTSREERLTRSKLQPKISARFRTSLITSPSALFAGVSLQRKNSASRTWMCSCSSLGALRGGATGALSPA
jgi:hypothetical protein